MINKQYIKGHNVVSWNLIRRNRLYTYGINHFTHPRRQVSLCEHLPLQILTVVSEITPRDQQDEKVTAHVLQKRMVLVIEHLSIGREVNRVSHAGYSKTRDPRPMRDDGISEQMSFQKGDGKDE
jgi:hypothetical protein